MRCGGFPTAPSSSPRRSCRQALKSWFSPAGNSAPDGTFLLGAPLSKVGKFDRIGSVAMSEGLRVYNLFPTLAGTIRQWTVHLPRIAAMGFNAVYVNPFHYP